MIDLKIGDIIRHLKRGSSYEVLGIWDDTPWDWTDGADFYLNGFLAPDGESAWHLNSVPSGEQGFALKVRLQVGDKPVQPFVNIVLYRALESKRGEPWLFARPLPEFTPDRFEKVSQ